MKVTVRRFVPEFDDKLAYKWLPSGIARPYRFASVEEPGAQKLEISPYAMVSIEETTLALREYIDMSVLMYLNDVIDKSEPVLAQTFNIVYQFAQKHSVSC